MTYDLWLMTYGLWAYHIGPTAQGSPTHLTACQLADATSHLMVPAFERSPLQAKVLKARDPELAKSSDRDSRFSFSAEIQARGVPRRLSKNNRSGAH